MTDAPLPAPVAQERRLRAALGVALLVLLPVLFALGPVADNDLGFHLKTGEWIWQHRAIPHTDPFSQVGGTRPWVPYSWLFEVGLYGLYAALGLPGMVLYRAVFGALIGFALWRIAASRAHSRWSAFLAALAAVLTLHGSLTERPWLVSMLFTALSIDAALRLRSGLQRHAFYLVPLYALWANLHAQFVYGLAVLGLAAFAAQLDRGLRRPDAPAPEVVRRLAVLTLACAAATLLNPFGPGIYALVLSLAGMLVSLQQIAEFRPPSFAEWEDWLTAAAALGAIAVLVVRRPRGSFEPLLLAMGVLLGGRSERDSWLMAWTAVPLLSRWPLPAPQPARPRTARLAMAVELVLATAGLLLLGAAVSRQTEPMLERELAWKLPVDAVRFIEERQLPGPLYNDFNWGGFLIWKLPRLPVSMDGRTTVYTDEEVRAHVRTWSGTAPKDARDPALARANLVLADRTAPLTAELERDPAWKLVYQDALADVLVRVGR